ncbi:hypothetical protein [Methylobacterium sp. 391_Methyba4]|uniref:hypothetical protein n=1 Tax=Methylobacterium sp. 391_Methyba4 TaxID=3038924 RepID=UPI00241D821D|nr:hypothetical protein [Methylobacterium sp. 391_Methyba4]WFS07739.1 hypothetical protein P9K36_00080 [Methylobacterium sp. 391_Methyba4]
MNDSNYKASQRSCEEVTQRRTAALQDQPEVFALVVVGNELMPRVRDGQTVIVERELPRTGDLAFVQLHAEDIQCLRQIGIFDPEWLNRRSREIEHLVELAILSPKRSEFLPLSEIAVLRRVLAL